MEGRADRVSGCGKEGVSQDKAKTDRERLREISGVQSRDSRLCFSQLQTGELTMERGGIIYGKDMDMYGVVAKSNQQVIEYVMEKTILS